MIVIIGAGPAGLYLAIKLKKEGIPAKDILVLDPRAGTYTRPGHLNESAFRKGESGLGISFWSGGSGHIKDFERHLYRQAQTLAIRIEQKRFIGLKTDPKYPGVIVSNQEQEREEISADYVFDCTGSRREVIQAANALSSHPPFQLKTIIDLPVHHHFLAYVRMSDSDLEDISIRSQMMEKMPEIYMKHFPGAYSDSILQLRELGWKEFSLPRCYGVSFGKNKVCLYLQAPAALRPENYDAWVETTIKSYAPTASYQQLPPSKKYPSKPRFLPFRVNAQYLDKVSYRGENMPTIIALADAQIDPDYYLAHGIYNGMERIDALLEKTIEIVDGKICYFDADEYLEAINKLLEKHKKDIIEEAGKQKEIFRNSLKNIRPDLFLAAQLTLDASKKEKFAKLLLEANARVAYEKACQDFAEIHHSSDQLKKERFSTTALFSKLENIQSNLTKAQNDLPGTHQAEKDEVLLLLSKLAGSWKELGNLCYKAGNMDKAVKAYNNAIRIYGTPELNAKAHLSAMTATYSNLTIACLKKNDFLSAIRAAQRALEYIEIHSGAGIAAQIMEKLVFNLNQALCSHASELLEKGERESARFTLNDEAIPLIKRHQKILSPANYQSASKIIEELQEKMTSSENVFDRVK